MKLAAVADVHFKAENYESDVHQFAKLDQLADALVVAGDLTNHGMPEEMRGCLEVLEECTFRLSWCLAITTTRMVTKTN